jgi:hypothetical protein
MAKPDKSTETPRVSVFRAASVGRGTWHSPHLTASYSVAHSTALAETCQWRRRLDIRVEGHSSADLGL